MDESRMYEVEAKTNRHEEEIKEIKGDIKDLCNKTTILTELSMTIKAFAESLKDVKDTVTDIKKDQDGFKDEIAELKSAPNKNKAESFDKLITAVVSLLGGAILTYILSAMFPALFK